MMCTRIRFVINFVCMLIIIFFYRWLKMIVIGARGASRFHVRLIDLKTQHGVYPICKCVKMFCCNVQFDLQFIIE